eukprot:m.150872 g.150872  ORF g.150872 m.150872 type:complete len:165 (-) comp17836_c0_seq3:123-617(-)
MVCCDVRYKRNASCTSHVCVTTTMYMCLPQVGLAGDIWALGCVLWEAGTGDSLPLGDGPRILGRAALMWDLEDDTTLQGRNALLDQLGRTLRTNSEATGESSGAAEANAVSTMLDVLPALWHVDPVRRCSAQQLYDLCQPFESTCFFRIDPTNVPSSMESGVSS